MKVSRGKIITSVVIILLALGSLYFTVFPSPPQHALLAHEGLGNELAKLAATAASSGGKIVLVAPDTSVFANPHIDAQVKSFRKQLRAANLSIATTNLIKLDPLRLSRVPPGDFTQWLRKLNEKDVVVSLMGPPLLNADQRAKLPTKLPHIIAVCSGEAAKQIPMKELFAAGLMKSAIVSRPDVPKSETANSAQSAFERAFRVVTAADVEQLQTSIGGGL